MESTGITTVTAGVSSPTKPYVGPQAEGNEMKYEGNFRTGPGRVEYRVEEDLDHYDNPVHLAVQLTAFVETHSDCDLDFDCYTNYGSRSHTFKIIGWRPATDEERKILKDQRRKEKQAMQKVKERELERARTLLQEAGEL